MDDVKWPVSISNSQYVKHTDLVIVLLSLKMELPAGTLQSASFFGQALFRIEFNP